MKDLDQHDIITEAVHQIIAKLACSNAILVQYKLMRIVQTKGIYLKVLKKTCKIQTWQVKTSNVNYQM